VQLAYDAGFSLGNGVMCHEDIRVLRQYLEVSVVAVSVAREDDDLARRLNAPGERRYSTVNDSRGGGRQIRGFIDRSHFVLPQGNIMGFELVAVVGSRDKLAEVAPGTMLRIKQIGNELGS